MTSFNPKDLLPKSSTATATKRSGVGSTKTQQQNDNISEDWTKFGKRQILSIGNKKRHRNQHDDIEEDDNIDVGNESSSDEEEGRTSAVREKKKRKVVAKVSSTHQIDVPKTNTDGGIEGVVDSTVGDIITSNTKKKKKKKGKKERAKDNNKDTSIEQQSLDENTTDAQHSVAKEVASDKDVKETTATKDDSITTNTNDTSSNTATNTNATNTNTKRKRKKVRSRQKNIRKDNREVKPSHLIIGNDDYKGRPMTRETCDKLGIQSKKVDSRKKRKGNVDAMFDSGQWVGDGEDKNDTATNDSESNVKNTAGEEDIKQPKEDVGNTLTRIGDCIVGNSSNIDNDDDTNKDDVGENLLNEDSKKKKGKKHKKKKFKNLVVG